MAAETCVRVRRKQAPNPKHNHAHNSSNKDAWIGKEPKFMDSPILALRSFPKVQIVLR